MPKTTRSTLRRLVLALQDIKDLHQSRMHLQDHHNHSVSHLTPALALALDQALCVLLIVQTWEEELLPHRLLLSVSQCMRPHPHSMSLLSLCGLLPPQDHPLLPLCPCPKQQHTNQRHRTRHHQHLRPRRTTANPMLHHPTQHGLPRLFPRQATVDIKDRTVNTDHPCTRKSHTMQTTDRQNLFRLRRNRATTHRPLHHPHPSPRRSKEMRPTHSCNRHRHRLCLHPHPPSQL